MECPRRISPMTKNKEAFDDDIYAECDKCGISFIISEAQADYLHDSGDVCLCDICSGNIDLDPDEADGLEPSKE